MRKRIQLSHISATVRLVVLKMGVADQLRGVKDLCRKVLGMYYYFIYFMRIKSFIETLFYQSKEKKKFVNFLVGHKPSFWLCVWLCVCVVHTDLADHRAAIIDELGQHHGHIVVDGGGVVCSLSRVSNKRP